MRFHIEHALPCDVDTFWRIFFDKTFNERLWTEQLKAPTYEELVDELQPSGDRRRKFRVVLPPLELPAPVLKLINRELGYTESGTYSKAQEEYRFSQELTILTDRISIGGALRVRPAPGGGVVRSGDVDVTVKIFAIGGLAERAAESNVRQAWELATTFMIRWIERERSA